VIAFPGTGHDGRRRELGSHACSVRYAGDAAGVTLFCIIGYAPACSSLPKLSPYQTVLKLAAPQLLTRGAASQFNLTTELRGADA
jgi:hypothetical protein